jgi:hypothetical protein
MLFSPSKSSVERLPSVAVSAAATAIAQVIATSELKRVTCGLSDTYKDGPPDVLEWSTGAVRRVP